MGMCGDGANDAPALRQAQMGIAVSTATDVAKSAAGMVLTSAGLAGILAAIREGRITFQRIQTYTLNSITSKILQVMLLTVCLFVTGQAILTPLLMVIIMITGDFLGMSLTTDNVRPSPQPDAWRIGRLTGCGVIMGLGSLVFCCAVLAYGDFARGYDIERLRTMAFVAVVAVRAGNHLHQPRAAVALVVTPEPMADGIVRGRCGDRLDALDRRHRHDAPASRAGGRHAGRRSGLRLCPGRHQGAYFSAPGHSIGRHECAALHAPRGRTLDTRGHRKDYRISQAQSRIVINST